MAWYPLPPSANTLPAGDEFFENQSAGWSLWSLSSSDDQNKAGLHSEKREQGAAQCSTRRAGEQSEGPSPLEQEFTQRTEDIFMSQFSDEEMRRMDAPFEALDMFPDSMHRLLSYENMLSGVLSGSANQDAELDQNGVDTMDTCGFPLFSHDLQSSASNGEANSSQMLLADPVSKNKAGVSMVKRSRSTIDTESLPGFEAVLLEEFEDVVFQLTKKTRICFRDAFYRLAESSNAKRNTANGKTKQGSIRRGFQQQEGDDASRMSMTPGCPGRETNAIDRTVADLTLKPPCSADQLLGNCFTDDFSGRDAVHDQLDRQSVEGS